MSNARTRKVASAFFGSAGFFFAAMALLMTPGLTPLNPEVPTSGDDAVCKVAFLALDPNNPTVPDPAKEVPGAMGPAVAARDEAGIKAQLSEDRTCGSDGKYDPAMTATHYAEWSFQGLTSRTVGFDGIDIFKAQLIADPNLYGSVMQELTSLENGSAFSTEELPAGLWSVYMKADGAGGVTTHQGQTTAGGTAAVFTHGDKVVKYRLDCRFQPVHTDRIPGLPECEVGACTPPPYVPPVVVPEPECQYDCSPPPVCEYDCGGDTPKNYNEDPWMQGNAPDGGGPSVDPGPGTFIPAPQMEQPPAAPRVDPAPPAPEPAPQQPSDPHPIAPDPAPAPAPEPVAPAPEAPEVGCTPIPDVMECP